MNGRCGGALAAAAGMEERTRTVTGFQDRLLGRIEGRAAVVGVVGLGHVGLPLAVAAAQGGHRTLGFDVSPRVVDCVNAGRSHIHQVPSDQVSGAVGAGCLEATAEFGRLAECDVVVVCVPTPLNKVQDPDLSHVIAAMRVVGEALRPGRLVVLESTTYPGTTRDVVLPILAESGLTVGEDYFLCFSPERVDPGNPIWHSRNTPRLLGGITPTCADVGLAFYRTIVETVVPVDSAEVAELAKVYENAFRMINIALANELARVCARLRLDVWQVIEAASTKPFGFMRFLPGPGLGGHCIPIDPHYLSWKMETLDFKTRLIEQASEINGGMPTFVVQLVADALNDDCRAVRGSRVLILGVAYKPDVDDYRESPAIEIIRLLQEKGADVAYHDPLCPTIHGDGLLTVSVAPLASVALTDVLLAEVDAVVLVTDHGGIDYQRVANQARLVIDTRGALRTISGRARIVGLSGLTTPGLQATEASAR
jgi:UDP-N-acetyl-D-glucosamine dehydrogenase